MLAVHLKCREAWTPLTHNLSDQLCSVSVGSTHPAHPGGYSPRVIMDFGTRKQFTLLLTAPSRLLRRLPLLLLRLRKEVGCLSSVGSRRVASNAMLREVGALSCPLSMNLSPAFQPPRLTCALASVENEAVQKVKQALDRVTRRRLACW